MTIFRGLIGVLVALAVSVGFVQFLELMLANAVAGGALQTLTDYALVLNTWPLLAMRLVISSFMALLGGYVCAKLAEHDEMRYTLIAVIFRLIAMAAGNAAGYMPPKRFQFVGCVRIAPAENARRRCRHRVQL